jgi:hypothetical protein
MGETVGLRQGAHEVHVDVGKTPTWYGDVFRQHVDVADYLCSLAVQAVAGPRRRRLGETNPDVPGCEEATGGAAAGVGGVVDLIKYLFLKVLRHQGAELTC